MPRASDGCSPSPASSSTASCAAGSASWPSTAGPWSGRPTASPGPPPTPPAPRCTSSSTPRRTRRTSRRRTSAATSRRSCTRFLDHVEVVVTIHGFGRQGLFTSLLLGGRNRELAARLEAELAPALPGYDIVTDLELIPRELRGLHPGNPVNVPTLAGVQIELPPRVRGLTPHWADWDGEGFVPPAAAVVESLARVARSWDAIGGAVVTRRALVAVVTGACLAVAGCAADGRRRHPAAAAGGGQHGGAGHGAAGSSRRRRARRGAPATDHGRRATSTDDHDSRRRPPRASPRRSATGTAPASTPARSPPSPRSAGADALSFDRYSYTVPGSGTVDAGGMQAEPVAAWWRQSPFSNVRVQLRTFVLAPDVEVLMLDESGRAAACAEPPPAAPPTPRGRRRRRRCCGAPPSPGRSPR